MGNKSSMPSSGESLRKKFNLSHQQYDDLKQIFKENSKGKNELSKREFRRVYSSRFPGNATGFADKMFDCFDKDGSGTVDFGEFVTGICMMDSDKIEHKIDIAFDLFDQDKSGYIDRQEVLDLLKAYNDLYSSSANEINPKKVANQLFETMDTNNDNQISKDEFIQAVQRIPELLNLIRPDPGD